MKKSILEPTEFNSHYSLYLDRLPDELDLTEGYKTGREFVLNFFKAIPLEKLNYCYQPKKWSLKEVLQHIIDTERIFMYRILRIARNDTTTLAGFEENNYIVPSGATNKSIEALLEEYTATRNYSINLMASLSDKNLSAIGNCNGTSLSARAAAFIILAHEHWHVNIIRERYL